MSQLPKNTILVLLCSLLVALAALPLAVATARSPQVQNGTLSWVVFRKTIHVTLANGLGEGLPVTMHCESEQNHDSIGTVSIPDGQTFEFSFKPNFWGSTEWMCNFIWRDVMGTYEIYIYKRDHHLCGKHCHWDITRRGLFGPGPAGSQIYYPWPQQRA